MKITAKKTALVWLVLIQWVLAYEWLQAAWEKFSKPDFINSISNTLAAFASKTSYGFYSHFLTSVGIPHAHLFGELVRYGELLIGAGLLVGGYMILTLRKLAKWQIALLITALLGGALLNLNFYWAAGWSGPSTSGINVVMGWISLILAIHYIVLLRSADRKF